MIRSHILTICVSTFLLNCLPAPRDKQSEAPGIEEFSTTTDGKRFLVRHPSFAGKSYEMQVYSGYPEILEWRELPSGIHYLLVYEAGSMGTAHHLNVSRAKVINLNTGEEIIDEIWSYTDAEGRPDSQTTDPVWIITKTHLLLKTSSQDKPESISLR